MRNPVLATTRDSGVGDGERQVVTSILHLRRFRPAIQLRPGQRFSVLPLPALPVLTRLLVVRSSSYSKFPRGV